MERCELVGRELAGQVVKLEWVEAQVVELAFAVDVLDVQEGSRSDCLIARRVSGATVLAVRIVGVVRRPVMFDQSRVLPAPGGLAAQDREQADAIVRCRRGTCQPLERLRQIYVLGEQLGSSVDRYAGAGHDKRDADVGVERGELSGRETVLAGVQAVVGAEDDVRIARQVVRIQRGLDPADHPVDRLHRLGALSERPVDQPQLAGAQWRVPGKPERGVRWGDVEVRRLRGAEPREVVCRAARGCTDGAARTSQARGRTACVGPPCGR